MSNAIQNMAARIRHTAAAVLKRRVLAMGVATVLTLGFMAALSQVPDRYQATARVHVDTQTVLRPMMANLTYQPDIDQQVRMLARTLVSRPNVEKLMQQPGLGFDTRDPARRDETVSRLMKDIRIEPTGTGNIYDITYRGPTPALAYGVVDATLALFMHESTAQKRNAAASAGQFIETQIRSHEAKLVEAEEKLRQFRTRNFGVSGVSEQDYYARVSAATEQVEKLQAELRAAMQGRDALRRELAQEDPQLPLLLQDTQPEHARRLEAQRHALGELRTRYTDQHPDVVAAQRMLDHLQAQAWRPLNEDVPAASGAAASAARSGHAATSPVYQKLRIALAEAEAQMAALASQLSTKQSQLAQVRALADRSPQVEAEHAQLNRDYDVVRKNYELLVARRESAALGERLDASAQLTDFRMIEPPRVSAQAAFPSRLHLGVAALLLALVGGLAAALVADQLSPTVDDLDALRKLTARPALGAIEHVVDPKALRQRAWSSAGHASALALLVLTQAVWLGWLISGHPTS